MSAYTAEFHLERQKKARLLVIGATMNSNDRDNARWSKIDRSYMAMSHMDPLQALVLTDDSEWREWIDAWNRVMGETKRFNVIIFDRGTVNHFERLRRWSPFMQFLMQRLATNGHLFLPFHRVTTSTYSMDTMYKTPANMSIAHSRWKVDGLGKDVLCTYRCSILAELTDFPYTYKANDSFESNYFIAIELTTGTIADLKKRAWSSWQFPLAPTLVWTTKKISIKDYMQNAPNLY
jgi:hypothetical protein